MMPRRGEEARLGSKEGDVSARALIDAKIECVEKYRTTETPKLKKIKVE
jgi:hypothetical protein